MIAIPSINKQYYCLVASLGQWGQDSDPTRIDFTAIRSEIADELSVEDGEAMELLYSYYDVENLLAAIRESDLQHNSLGNFTEQQIAAEIAAAGTDDEPFESQLPPELRYALDVYQGRVEIGDDEPDLTAVQKNIERSLLEGFYRRCEASPCEFLRRWAADDRLIRNTIAGADSAIGAVAEDTKECEWYAPLQEVLSTADFVEREHRMDTLRWNLSEQLSEGHYFDVAEILSYLIKLNILQRWALLSKERGRERFSKIVNSFTSKLKI